MLLRSWPLGTLVGWQGAPLVGRTSTPIGGTFLVRCGLPYRHVQGEADRLCIPAGGCARRCTASYHDGPLGGHFAKAGSLALWVGQDVDIADNVAVRSCQTCQRTKAEHGGPHGLVDPLPPPSRRGGMIGVDWIAGLPTTAAGFDMIQNHVDLLPGKVHAVPTPRRRRRRTPLRSFATMCRPVRSGTGFPDVLVVDHDAKLTSEVFRALVKSMGSCHIVGSAYHKNTNDKVERANGVISDTLRAYSNGHKDDWDSRLTLAE